MVQREEWAEAAAAFRAVLEHRPPEVPEVPEARFWAGFCLVKLGDYEPAAAMLRPFEEELSSDRWADDALVQLGRADVALGRPAQALANWKRHLERYPESVWRTEVTLGIIDVLFYHASDVAECHGYCERLVGEVADRGATGEARYLGAYCLNALRRFADAEAWADRLFDPESPLEEAWRRLLELQRDLLRGRIESALAAVDSLASDYPDLDPASRRDLLSRASQVLRFNGRADRARELLLDELRRGTGLSADEVASLLAELAQLFDPEHRASYLGALGALADEPAAPVVARVTAREWLVQGYREDGRSAEAADLLRGRLAGEPTEFGRVRGGLQLAEVLADDLGDRGGAASVLEELQPGLRRRDLARRVQEAIEGYRDGSAP
jgi:tetratricopeptide (TPR) repeat protein